MESDLALHVMHFGTYPVMGDTSEAQSQEETQLILPQLSILLYLLHMPEQRPLISFNVEANAVVDLCRALWRTCRTTLTTHTLTTALPLPQNLCHD